MPICGPGGEHVPCGRPPASIIRITHLCMSGDMTGPSRVEPLDRLIEAYLGGEASFEAFATGYASCFITLPDAAFADVDAEVWYGVLHERLERAAPDPPPEARAYGWTSIGEFRDWLQSYVHARGGPSPDR